VSTGFSIPPSWCDEVYRIGPSDIIEVIVWREDDISRSELLVRPDGRISLPLVDDVLVAGLTPMELKQTVTKALARYVESPQVYVEIKQPESHYFCVLGNVNNPGRFPLLTPTSVLHALSLAQGFNKWAKKDDIVIIKGMGAKQKRLVFNYSDVVSGEKMEQNISLSSGDVVVVP
jgi:polysaccharide export outer membrane protein